MDPQGSSSSLRNRQRAPIPPAGPSLALSLKPYPSLTSQLSSPPATPNPYASPPGHPLMAIDLSHSFHDDPEDTIKAYEAEGKRLKEVIKRFKVEKVEAAVHDQTPSTSRYFTNSNNKQAPEPKEWTGIPIYEPSPSSLHQIAQIRSDIHKSIGYLPTVDKPQPLPSNMLKKPRIVDALVGRRIVSLPSWSRRIGWRTKVQGLVYEVAETGGGVSERAGDLDIKDNSMEFDHGSSKGDKGKGKRQLEEHPPMPTSKRQRPLSIAKQVPSFLSARPLSSHSSSTLSNRPKPIHETYDSLLLHETQALVCARIKARAHAIHVLPYPHPGVETCSASGAIKVESIATHKFDDLESLSQIGSQTGSTDHLPRREKPDKLNPAAPPGWQSDLFPILGHRLANALSIGIPLNVSELESLVLDAREEKEKERRKDRDGRTALGGRKRDAARKDDQARSKGKGSEREEEREKQKQKKRPRLSEDHATDSHGSKSMVPLELDLVQEPIPIKRGRGRPRKDAAANPAQPLQSFQQPTFERPKAKPRGKYKPKRRSIEVPSENERDVPRRNAIANGSGTRGMESDSKQVDDIAIQYAMSRKRPSQGAVLPGEAGYDDDGQDDAGVARGTDEEVDELDSASAKLFNRPSQIANRNNLVIPACSDHPELDPGLNAEHRSASIPVADPEFGEGGGSPVVLKKTTWAAESPTEEHARADSPKPVTSSRSRPGSRGRARGGGSRMAGLRIDIPGDGPARDHAASEEQGREVVMRAAHTESNLAQRDAAVPSPRIDGQPLLNQEPEHGVGSYQGNKSGSDMPGERAEMQDPQTAEPEDPIRPNASPFVASTPELVPRSDGPEVHPERELTPSPSPPATRPGLDRAQPLEGANDKEDEVFVPLVAKKSVVEVLAHGKDSGKDSVRGSPGAATAPDDASIEAPGGEIGAAPLLDHATQMPSTIGGLIPSIPDAPVSDPRDPAAADNAPPDQGNLASFGEDAQAKLEPGIKKPFKATVGAKARALAKLEASKRLTVRTADAPGSDDEEATPSPVNADVQVQDRDDVPESPTSLPIARVGPRRQSAVMAEYSDMADGRPPSGPSAFFPASPTIEATSQAQDHDERADTPMEAGPLGDDSGHDGDATDPGTEDEPSVDQVPLIQHTLLYNGLLDEPGRQRLRLAIENGQNSPAVLPGPFIVEEIMTNTSRSQQPLRSSKTETPRKIDTPLGHRDANRRLFPGNSVDSVTSLGFARLLGKPRTIGEPLFATAGDPEQTVSKRSLLMGQPAKFRGASRSPGLGSNGSLPFDPDADGAQHSTPVPAAFKGRDTAVMLSAGRPLDGLMQDDSEDEEVDQDGQSRFAGIGQAEAPPSASSDRPSSGLYPGTQAVAGFGIQAAAEMASMIAEDAAEP